MQFPFSCEFHLRWDFLMSLECFQTVDGECYMFGSNQFGQLGCDKDPGSRRPVHVTSLKQHIISMLACGDIFTVAVTSGNTISWLVVKFSKQNGIFLLFSRMMVVLGGRKRKMKDDSWIFSDFIYVNLIWMVCFKQKLSKRIYWDNLRWNETVKGIYIKCINQSCKISSCFDSY